MQYDAQGFAIASDGTKLFWGVRGHGSAIVLTDGIGCDGWAWTGVQPALAQHHQTVHWHYRGHGRSGPPQERRRIDIVAHALDLFSVLDNLGIEKAILTGHSMGVQVCLEAYRQRPERVNGIILVCGSYGRVTKTFHGNDSLETILPVARTLVKKYSGIVRGIWGRMPPRLSYQIAKLTGEIDALAMSEDEFMAYIDHLASMDPGLFLAMLEHAGTHTAEDMLENITVPTLIISGELDTFTPAVISATMAEKIPGAELFEVRGGTHSAPVEQPAAVSMRIEKFLAEHFSKS